MQPPAIQMRMPGTPAILMYGPRRGEGIKSVKIIFFA
jgi:hypothetical protein